MNMKQVYTFYYTGKEHRASQRKMKTCHILAISFFLCFVCLDLIAVLFYAFDYHLPDP